MFHHPMFYVDMNWHWCEMHALIICFEKKHVDLWNFVYIFLFVGICVGLKCF
jgi:hypothetical protein